MVVTAADPALCGAVFSADLRSRYAGAVGIPVLLLVPVCVGDPGFRTDGNRLLEVQGLEGRNRKGNAPDHGRASFFGVGSGTNLQLIIRR